MSDSLYIAFGTFRFRHQTRGSMSTVRFTARLVALICFTVTTGCSKTLAFFKANPAPQTAHTSSSGEMELWPDRLPWHGVRFKNRDDFYKTRSKYRRTILAPVRTDVSVQTGWWDELNVMDDAAHRKAVVRLADYMRQRFAEEITNDPNKRYRLTEQVGMDVLILELALVEVVPTKFHWNAAGTALGIFVPGGGLLKTATMARGSVAFEARVIESTTGEVLVTFRDREQDQFAPVSIADFTPYRHAERAIDAWAEQFIEVVNTPMSHKVSDTLPMTLAPW